MFMIEICLKILLKNIKIFSIFFIFRKVDKCIKNEDDYKILISKNHK